ncbi:hypothetical protein HAX54_039376, partial [Datura stramonium]|nr:hypothetical protein [Datura stramonium]
VNMMEIDLKRAIKVRLGGLARRAAHVTAPNSCRVMHVITQQGRRLAPMVVQQGRFLSLLVVQ